MGSWNHTCGISGLSINDGDKVALVLLSETKRGVDGNSSYISDNFTPVTVPLICEYTDYGDFKLDSSSDSKTTFKIMLKYLKDHIKNDVNVDKKIDISKIKTLKHLMEFMQEGELFVKGIYFPDEDPKNYHREVFVFPILYSIYEQILASKVSPSWHGPTLMKNLEEREKLDNVINFDRSVLTGYELETFNNKKEAIEKSDLNDVEKKKKIDEERKMYLSMQLWDLSDCFSGRSFDGHGPNAGVRNMVTTILVYNELKFTKDEQKHLSEKILELIMVHYSMSNWRMPWKPVTGFGSQSNNEAHIKRLGRFINKSIKDRKES
jgi:hypothetical protein